MGPNRKAPSSSQTGTPIKNQNINRPSLLKWWLTLFVLAVAADSLWDFLGLLTGAFVANHLTSMADIHHSHSRI